MNNNNNNDSIDDDDENEWKELFVPGRLCVLGEHSDWSARYASENPAISSGATIVCTTNEGLYTRCRKIPLEKDENQNEYPYLKFKSKSSNNEDHETIVKFDVDQLILDANSGGYFSYVYGTTAVILKAILLPKLRCIDYGIEIINYETTLPMKKGLSSSAAVCVTVAKCFDILFHLRLDLQTIMEIAYKGESLTPSKCGRMDQCVAMGSGSIGLMEFGLNSCSLSVLRSNVPLYFVVADLKAGKNTITILNELNKCFPFPEDENKNMMHRYILENHELIWSAVNAIEKGDTMQLAKAMNNAQINFDKCIVNCPSELTSPKLHQVINDENLRAVSLAIKGVGSQGDGSVQVLCASSEMQVRALDILQTQLGCDGFLLTIPCTNDIDRPNRSLNRIRFAMVIFDPLSLEVYQPSSFSNISCGGDATHVSWLSLVKELIASGIEKIVIIVPSSENIDLEQIFLKYCESLPPVWTYERDQSQILRSRIQFLHQHPQEFQCCQSIMKAIDIFAENNDDIGNEKIMICRGEFIPSNASDQGLKKIISTASINNDDLKFIVSGRKVELDEEIYPNRLYMESILIRTVNRTLITSLRQNTSPTRNSLIVFEGIAILSMQEAHMSVQSIIFSDNIEEKRQAHLHPVDAFITNTIGPATKTFSGVSLGQYHSLLS